MKQQRMKDIVLIGAVAAVLTACGAGAQSAATLPPAAQAPTATMPLPTLTAPTAAPTTAAFDLGVSGIGEVKAAQDADLVFQVQGTVAEVKVKEGDSVKRGDLLAILDTRGFDQQVQQAAAAVASAKATLANVDQAPRSADAAAAAAAVRQAQAALDVLKAGAKPQDLQAAQAAVTAAQAQLQTNRDKLSQAKTTAEAQLQQATAQLTQAQATFAQAKSDWDYVQETGRNPANPTTINPQTGKPVANKVNDSQREQYYAAFVRAQAALRAAEEGVRIAQIAYDTARQNEVTGIQAAEQQVVQAQATLDKLQLPPDKDRLAAAEAALAQARANQAKLTGTSREAQVAQAQAGIAQAEAALKQAQINRERAELRAPFDGVVAVVNIDPGDPSTTQGPAIRLVDVSSLTVEVQISDTDIGRVYLGQAATVVADALPDRKFKGKVSFISPTAIQNGTLRSYKVKIVPDTIEGLRAGMSVRVQLAAP